MKNIIEINGRKYDAITGKLLTEPKVLHDKTPKNNIPHPIKMAATIDGFSRRRPHAAPTVHKNHPTIVGTKTQFAPKRTEKSQTLLRTAVKKPIGPMTSSKSSSYGSTIKPIPESRLLRAKQVIRSQTITRFNNTYKDNPKVTTGLKVMPSPATKSAPPEPPFWGKFIPHKKIQKQQVFNHPIFKAINNNSQNHTKIKLHKRIANSLHIKISILAIILACIVIVGLAGILAYRSVPSIAMKVADSQAGFPGILPSNIPAGYSFKGPIKYSKNIITIEYKSDTNNIFTVTQKPTNWTSESLEANFLSNPGSDPITFHSQGLTVYIYGSSDATWVDKGVWYIVNSNGTLSSDQILALAGSL